MSDLVLRLARSGEDARIADFINQNFDMRLPLITFWPTRAKRRMSGFQSGLPQRAITVWDWS